MDKKPLKPAKLFIWDLDNVIYPYDDAFHRACHEAAARAATGLGVEMEYEQALGAAQESYRKYGTSFDIFIKEFGIPQLEMHKRYHDELSLDFLKPEQRLSVGFAGAGARATHTILTHGSTDWAGRVLDARGIRKHFRSEHIVGTEQLNFARKHLSAAPFEHMLRLTGHGAGDAIMVEDTAANLAHPKAMGMQTVFISYGKGDGNGHADHVFETAQDFLQAYCKQHRRSRQPD